VSIFIFYVLVGVVVLIGLAVVAGLVELGAILFRRFRR
jgi:hypothetical protein